jgi:Ca2+-binding RTX toxin-like protein
MRCITNPGSRTGVNRLVAWLIVPAGIFMMGQGCPAALHKVGDSPPADTSTVDQNNPPADTSVPDQNNQKQTKSHYSAHIHDGTLTIKGNSGDSQLALRLKAGDPTMLEVDVDDDGSADFSFDRGQFDHILVQGGKGNDVIRIDESNGVFTDTELTTIDGGEGDDTLTGGSGAETLIGGPGNDTINGGRGNDVVLLGEGDDTFIWNPGDGSDTVEGQAGTDKMIFNGANIAENIDISANGSRVRFFRDVANITMDLDGLEQIDFNALGGADNVVVNDLAGTDVKRVNVDLGAAGGVSDGQPDAVTVNGTPGPDTFNISPDGDALIVNGLVRVKGFEAANDRIVVSGVGGDVVNVNGTDGADTINITPSPVAGFARVNIVGISTSVDVTNVASLAIHGLGGPDTISGSNGLAALKIPLTLDGGPGDDVINGGDGDDMLIGGDGNDTIDGNRGNDVASMGAGDDTFIWDPGDGSDTVEGEGGNDKMVFNGANIAEKIDISANGSRVRFFRDVANITMDLNGVEQIDFNALGGADDIVVNDLHKTDITRVNVDLGATGGGSDGQPDTVTFNGNAAPNAFTISPDGDALLAKFDTISPDGVPLLAKFENQNSNFEIPSVRVRGFDPAADRLVISGDGSDTVIVNGTDGPDTMTITPSPVAGFARVNIAGIATSVDVANLSSLVVNGLGGPDTISGSNGLAALNIPLTLDGGPGDDVINGGDGDDMLIGGEGNDTIDGNRGNDVAFMGDGDDTFIWDPGDGSDTVEGQGGSDRMVFNGANISEGFDISASRGRVLFTRNIGTITMDLNQVERIDLNALGGADNLVVNDLTGTDCSQVNVNLAAGAGGSDLLADTVTVNGTAGADTIHIAANAGAVEVAGLRASVQITGTDPTLDKLIINGLAGVDTITADGGVAALILLTVNQD